ncbi:MAG: 50S ribosomal protein L11 methyltransferase [Candidatus Aramenus sulfurataquae]|jgi:16S rRNA A1518/A1519 N6-dimethyltransferase RsmA/KsgA/DIM1 with predicted DNA glycosylase/AP lyase activity|uniref:50S ribosomal protein L11 methyltransferase n=1 Tax=Candidatus Aramenus sulfurataquae TaxID=1326980 RepID=W7KXW0_9CREN|nr:MAG: 50S ribosomal protein L11 methyltransferase [Candidatus Aramenus sulfurataquae]
MTLLVPFVPSPPEVVEEMLKCANLSKDDVLLDLGCGDGRIIKAAKKNFHVRMAIGVEINNDLCLEARDPDVEVVCGDMVLLLEVLMPRVTVITAYLSTRTNEIIQEKILKLGRKGLRIVSHDFVFEKLRLKETRRVKAMGLLGWTEHTIYCYEL